MYWLRQYVAAIESMPEALPSEQKLENFLTHLARQRDLSASTQNQAFNAILFFYNEVLKQPLQDIDALRARRPVDLRHAPTVAETQALLQSVRDRAGRRDRILGGMRRWLAGLYRSYRPAATPLGLTAFTQRTQGSSFLPPLLRYGATSATLG